MSRKNRSIISECPCCGGQLVVDLDSGEVFSDQEVHIPENSKPWGTGITVQHATPDFNKYFDPTHINAKPVLTPPTSKPQLEEKEEPVIPLTKEQVERALQISRDDWRQRGYHLGD